VVLRAAGADSDGGLLHLAVEAKQPSLIVHLADRRANFNEVVNGQSPLAVWHSRIDAVSNPDTLYALKHGGADICAFLSSLETPNRATGTMQAVAPECGVANR
jgi:hypothetical protein